MAEVLHVPDVAVDVGDNSAATSLISEAAVPNGQDLKLLDDSEVQDTSEEVSSLIPRVKAAAVTSASAEGRHTPWFAWPLLFASLVAVSSAAVVFASIPDVPTFTLAAWRLQLTTCLLSPAAIYQYLRLSTGIQLVGVQYSKHCCYACSHCSICPTGGSSYPALSSSEADVATCS